ncbi:IS1182 family transposase [Chitinibacter fontanus]|uniref:IS1182 family transposase n=1 Tax=Chitinibacter fontanus TaxID=1737446 RepID=A0A7D5Z537_9NEIS|nr:IS1182 family transposase [Chitinibacter fontanus]QLI80681.1 IS1182 family transposase [Chitinibacter fontanus]QLI80682.1 IS1182 family transposase [Chitinibacter fontanus]QLI81177.1 IS1182 family transposase [Chitinibacter fontanus]QLI82153.1 IS1182 family transposase [Chitinibacter fontanus]
MPRFIAGESRTQTLLLPECLEDYVSADNPVRVVDQFVEYLDLKALGFDGVEPEATGRPAYHPSTMLKLYIYGYLNRIQSSRRLEREAHRNLELIWLTARLMPDFKTIANFRKDNGPAICKVCGQFVQLCRQLSLFSNAIVAIDGSKFKAVNHRDRNYTNNKLAKQREQIEANIASYLREMEIADRQQPDIAEAKVARLKDKLARLKSQMARLDEVEAQLAKTPDKQISLTDPDARSMATSGRGSGVVGYNVQTVVDAKHHLIIAHQVTNQGHDRTQLANMAQQAKAVLAQETLEVVADRGYYNGDEILACEQAGITVLVPKPQTSGAKADGRFGKDEFHYDPVRDEYVCPGNSRLIHRFVSLEAGRYMSRYWSSDCPRCPLKTKCTPSDYRRVSRWEHEAILEKAQQRLELQPDAMRVRRQTVEHPFGTLKAWMGATHFLMKTLKHVSTEMSLHILAYNMKRVMKIMGNQAMLAAMKG